MTVTPQQAWQVFQQADCLYDKQAVEMALDTMAVQISKDMADQNPLFVCVMSGALVTLGHLLTRLQFPLEIDYVHATRYRGSTQGGEIVWLAQPRKEIKDRSIIVVDDILDEGYTLAEIIREFHARGAHDVRSAVLVNKLHERRYQDLQANYVGLDVDDRYVFGYGMDYHDYLRNIDGIYAVAEER